MAPARPQPAFRPPRIDSWNWRIAAFLGAIWVVEIILENAGVPLLMLLSWTDTGAGFSLWQPLTWPLVQGRSVLWVLVQLYILGSILPAATGGWTDRERLQLGAWMWGGGIATALLLNGLSHLTGVRLAWGQVHGWAPALAGLFALFGLRNPQAQVLLFFVIPVRAEAFLWLAVGLPALYLLVAIPAGNTLGPAVTIGCWAGAYLWYHRPQRLSPRQKRKLRRQARDIRKELRVLRGGKDEDTWH